MSCHPVHDTGSTFKLPKILNSIVLPPFDQHSTLVGSLHLTNLGVGMADVCLVTHKSPAHLSGALFYIFYASLSAYAKVCFLTVHKSMDNCQDAFKCSRKTLNLIEVEHKKTRIWHILELVTFPSKNPFRHL